MKENRIQVIVTTSVEGIHRWAGCPFKEVEFLKNPHRHQFVIVAKKEVSHEDRDIEIIMLKRKINSFLAVEYGNPCEFGLMSCEMIAKALCEEFNLSYCSVLEDGENGAEITHNK